METGPEIFSKKMIEKKAESFDCVIRFLKSHPTFFLFYFKIA